MDLIKDPAWILIGYERSQLNGGSRVLGVESATRKSAAMLKRPREEDNGAAGGARKKPAPGYEDHHHKVCVVSTS